jgi:Domain of unknown function (DUF4396)
MPAWLEPLAIAVLCLCGACAVVIAAHLLAGHLQTMWIMNVVWPVTALYFGPAAVWYYFVYGAKGKEARRHLAFWHKAVVGTSHCGAGCTIGDLAGEWLVFLAGFTVAGKALWADFLTDFCFAYAIGILFQYFAIAPMRGVSGWTGLRAALRADTISLVAFEIGMFVFMGLSHRWFHPPVEPSSPVYWFLMQITMVAGSATSFPANWWLIRHGWKEAM